MYHCMSVESINIYTKHIFIQNSTTFEILTIKLIISAFGVSIIALQVTRTKSNVGLECERVLGTAQRFFL